MPVTFMMGIPYSEAFVAAELIGTKLFLNEFVAYKKLSELKNNRLNDTGSGGQLLSVRPSPWLLDVNSALHFCCYFSVISFSYIPLVIGL